MEIERLDHIVLTIKDLNKTILFYSEILGMKSVNFNNGRIALHFGKQKINIHILGQEIEPKAHLAKPGTADLCFITPTPMGEVMDILKRNNIEIIEGPVERIGATGTLFSIYLRDPDLNLIELSNYI